MVPFHRNFEKIKKEIKYEIQEESFYQFTKEIDFVFTDHTIQENNGTPLDITKNKNDHNNNGDFLNDDKSNVRAKQNANHKDDSNIGKRINSNRCKIRLFLARE